MPNKLLKCTYCKERFDRESPEWRRTRIGNFHNDQCAIDYGMRRIEANRKRSAAAKKKEDQAFRKETRERREKAMSRDEWYKRLQDLVNQYVLHVRDKYKPCCTCGTSKIGIKYDAGHYRSRGACKELRFELKNIHKQCSVQCNQHGSGMRSEYREFIVNEYNQETLEWLDGPHTTLKEQFPHYTDIKDEISRYRKLLRDNGLTPYR